LAVSRAFPRAKRYGYSHRAETREAALAAGVVDAVFDRVEEAAGQGGLVVLASPIGTFEELFLKMRDSLQPGTVVTDVGSTKVLPTRWAIKHLPKQVGFLGSHPMAGSEQRGVDFARADLFEKANCILTPTAKTKPRLIQFLEGFWTELGMHVSKMTPAQHDKVLARISHLPHILAAALVNSSELKQMLLCGKGFLDTTRLASGPENVWRDILMANAESIDESIARFIKELTNFQVALRQGDEDAVCRMLAEAREKRNQLVEMKLQRKELPA